MTGAAVTDAGGPLTLAPVAPADWPALAAGFADLGFEQGATYAAAAARRIGARVEYRVLRDGAGRPVAAAAVRVKTVPGLGRGIAWIAAGPLVRPGATPPPDAGRLAAILAAFRADYAGRQGHVLRLRLSGTAFVPPATMAEAARAAGLAPTRRAPPYRSYILPLDRDEAATMAALDGKWRTDLRFALKSGMTVDRGRGAALAGRFLALFGPVQQAKGFAPDIPPGFHTPLDGPDYAVETFIAHKDGQDLAGIVTGRCGAGATYLFGATADAGRPLRAGYLVQWEGIAAARAAGCRWYDLGGVDAGANPDVARFKARMGGLPVLAEAWEAVPGAAGRLVLALEGLRARLKGRRRSAPAQVAGDAA